MSKKEQLYQWMKGRIVFYTHEVQQWGLENFYTSADRMKRILMEEGKVRKLNDDERKDLNITRKEAAYTAAALPDFKDQFDF